MHSISIEDPTKNSFVLDGLEEFTLYEVLLQAYNDLGSSEPSPVVLARTREAAPGDGPTGVSAESTSSTTILGKVLLIFWKKFGRNRGKILRFHYSL